MFLGGLARDKESGLAESAGAPPAVPAPEFPGEAEDDAGAKAPMEVVETSRKRNVEEAAHEQDDAARGGRTGRSWING